MDEKIKRWDNLDLNDMLVVRNSECPLDEFLGAMKYLSCHD